MSKFHTNRPTEAGYYWILLNNVKSIVEIRDYPSGLVICPTSDESSDNLLGSDTTIQWSKKIKFPEEKE